MPSATNSSGIPQESLDSFSTYLRSSKRILALCGAGLSAASGLPTFRGVGGYWRAYNATSLATPEAWDSDPGLVWQFYNYRRHMALRARPNRAHLALAEFARTKSKDFLTITQNVDGLSQRAGHPLDTIEFLHGSLFEVRCDGFSCNWVDRNNTHDPIAPALRIDDSKDDISDADVELRDIPVSDLPKCPDCNALIRPGVVWFGESLPRLAVNHIDDWVRNGGNIDLILVIGTSAKVYPAAGYIQTARQKGARVAVVNLEPPEEEASRLQDGDWFFQGDAGEIVPKILESAVGAIPTAEQRRQGLL